MSDFAAIPLSWIGPLPILGSIIQESVSVPLATYETPLWPSTNRGAKAVRESGGVFVHMKSETMTRSILFETISAGATLDALKSIESQFPMLQEIVKKQSRFALLTDMYSEVVGNLLFLRFHFYTGDASGHNMATKAAESIQEYLLETFPTLRYLSVSGNYCTDKKTSAVNGILGRGKHMIADLLIPRTVCESVLKTTPEAIHELNIKKNWVGTQVAGTIRTANAHFANILLAFYLATGQDAANIVEGSQGFVHTEVRHSDLYFSITLPNAIVGTIGNGKHLPMVKNCLEKMGCLAPAEPGVNARRLAAILAATVLCGELSLLAAQTNRGELMRTHIAFERNTAPSKEAIS